MKRKQINKIATLLCIAIVLLLGIILGQTYQNYRKVSRTRSANQTNLQNLQKQIKTIQEQLAKYEEEQKDFERYLFKEEDVPAFLEGISRFAEQTGVNIIDMKTKKFRAVETTTDKTASAGNKTRGTSTAKGQTSSAQDELKNSLTLAAMPISFKITGAFQDVVKFLSHLEDFQQLLTITDIEIANIKTYPVLNCQFTLKIYSFKYIEEL
jgi:Tfp pilus assembly protein PilO